MGDFLEIGGRPAFKAESGSVDCRAFVLTPPKAGTYLVGAILTALGLIDTEVHCNLQALSDYRGRSNAEKVARSRELNVPVPFATATEMIRPGQFAVGHIPHNPDTIRTLGSFVKVVAVRELRAASASMMRFHYRRAVADPLLMEGRREWLEAPDGAPRMAAFLEVLGPWMVAHSLAVADWREEGDVVRVRFEDLLGDDGPTEQRASVAAIATALGRPDADADHVIRTSLGKETLTFSGSRTDLARFWDEAVERKFRAIGGVEANVALGY